MRKSAASAGVVTVSRNMAEAVSYLCGVATEAGLNRVALQLGGIRLHLLQIAEGDEAGATSRDASSRKLGGRDGKRNLS